MKDIFSYLSGGKVNSILHKMIRILLGSNLVIILVLVIIAFYGLGSALYRAEELVNRLGEVSYENSSELLVEQGQEELMYITSDNAKIISLYMESNAYDVEAVAREAGEIHRHSELYSPWKVAVPSEGDFKPLKIYLQHGAEVNPDNYRHEIALMGNIEGLLVRLLECNDMVKSFFVTSNHNFTLSVDEPDELEGNKENIPQTVYNAVEADWYKQAVEKGNTIFTDVRMFTFSNMPGLFCASPYYDDDGNLLGVASMEISLENMRILVRDINLPNAGFCFALDKKGRVILSSQKEAYAVGAEMELPVDLNKDIRTATNHFLAQIAQEMTLGHKGIQLAEIDGDEYFVAYTPIECTGWSFATVFAKDEVIAPVEKNREIIEKLTADKIEDMVNHIDLIILFMVVSIIVLLCLVIRVGQKLSGRFVASIQRLTDGVRDITKHVVIGTLNAYGDLPDGDKNNANNMFKKRVKINSGDEIEELANCFNIMTEELEGYMDTLVSETAEKERIATELTLAQDIQMGVLPHKFPPFPEHKEFTLYASMQSAREVGGDFYDFYMVDENHLAVTIADVSGKGVGAAMFMAISKTILKNLLLTGKNMTLSDIAAHANNQLKEDNTARMFVTAFIGLLDIRTGYFEYVNCGHNPSLIYEKETGAFRYLDVESNFVLAGRKNITYESQTLILKPGDSLFLYTDGVTEAMNNKDELYGEERLLSQLNCSKNADEPQSLLEEIDKSVATFVGDAEQSDDITMLALTYFGPVGEK
ncbi:Serine phosphatase RsbU, regulator of sigma subunit [Anaerovibrio sp. JC8]|uniref:SpoIIE family protein phosphatase n=1 Tax=Anaerovibrio sp. JC8 TaxID=1240085 RepID=UPI000A0D9D76|nr:SpoIIE family protein phosphatase [Anaerovibrio sp. JC8]ORT99744.1 Serine phosphatase RsbU, regulator of sigma subunit [Anaerovibrio sp. JC8]